MLTAGFNRTHAYMVTLEPILYDHYSIINFLLISIDRQPWQDGEFFVSVLGCRAKILIT